jgi:hypothetical protein
MLKPNKRWAGSFLASSLYISLLGKALSSDINCGDGYKNQAVNKNSPPFFTIGAWANSNHDAIEALSAAGTLILTLVLTGSTVGLWCVTKRSVDLARKEFFSTHRPHLIIRDLIVDGDEFMFLLINKGESPATIIESWIFTGYVADKKKIRPLLSAGYNDLKRLSTLGVGEITQIIWPLGVIGNAIKTGESSILGDPHLAITIVYADSEGHKRRSVFRRRWNFESERFEGSTSQTKNIPTSRARRALIGSLPRRHTGH